VSELAQNTHDLEHELAWLARLLDARFRLYFGASNPGEGPVAPPSDAELAPPDLSDARSPFAREVVGCELEFEERAALILALAPQLRPQLLDVFFTRNRTFDRPFTEFGGASTPGSGFVPTGETLAFLLGGGDLWARLHVARMLDARGKLARADLVRADAHDASGSPLRAPLRVSDDCLARLVLCAPHRPAFGASFPAQHIETRLGWDDLVLHPHTRAQVREIETWLEHGEALMRDWGMAPKLRPGLRALFHGPPGTGKTMTACLLGKSTGREVYRVDLALTVSKYIGETEKNLAAVLDQAQSKGWILFFDEADALFGKRSETRDAHDRYANHQTAFLLQRIETFDGVVILASNLRENIDAAFARRFESVIYFPVPRSEERLLLWRQGFSPKAQLPAHLDLERLARDHELCGSAIMNVIRYASLRALEHGGRPIDPADVHEGIRRENAKAGGTA
jgi:hypothetical protein